MTTAADKARQIWEAGVAAVRPTELLRHAVACGDGVLTVGTWRAELAEIDRIVVVGCGKAGAAMASALEAVLGDAVVDQRVTGWVNVPADTIAGVPPTRRIRLHPARSTAANVPTPEGVAGAERILELVRGCGPRDVCLCLISGGGSALLPAPAPGVSLADKLAVTKLLAGCGAAIDEINAVRKHLSAVKGGRLAAEFRGRHMFSLIISDVVGDPLDVIASGPTAADPSTFADALNVLERQSLTARVPADVMFALREGRGGRRPETLKRLPPNVDNRVIGSADVALSAAGAEAVNLGYSVLDLGAFIEGETRQVAGVFAGLVRTVRRNNQPVAAPACLLCGGETTVTLAADHGKGGRNQEFVLAAALKLGEAGLRGVTVLSGGTDGEDGPTDAAGAVADADLWRRARNAGRDPAAFLARNDAYTFFEPLGGLLKTGPTNTNVMDLRVFLIDP